MRTVVLYTNRGQESERVRQLISSLGDEFLEYTLDTHFSESQFVQEFGSEAEFPQVAIDTQHIGGLKETLNYLKERGLI